METNNKQKKSNGIPKVNEPIHFLIVDDKKVYINIVINAIKENRPDVEDIFTEAIDGKDALNKMLKNIPDIIITDYNMPEMDGLQFIKSVRSINNEKIKDVPIIMLTSVGQKAEVLKVMQYGLAGYILKPASGTKIWTQVRRCIKIIEYSKLKLDKDNLDNFSNDVVH